MGILLLIFCSLGVDPMLTEVYERLSLTSKHFGSEVDSLNREKKKLDEAWKYIYLLPAIKMLAKLNTLQDAEYFLYWNYSLAGEKKKKKVLINSIVLDFYFSNRLPKFSAIKWEEGCHKRFM